MTPLIEWHVWFKTVPLKVLSAWWLNRIQCFYVLKLFIFIRDFSGKDTGVFNAEEMMEKSSELTTFFKPEKIRLKFQAYHCKSTCHSFNGGYLNLKSEKTEMNPNLEYLDSVCSNEVAPWELLDEHENQAEKERGSISLLRE